MNTQSLLKQSLVACIWVGSVLGVASGCSNEQKGKGREPLAAKANAGSPKVVEPAKLVQKGAEGPDRPASSVEPPAAPPGNATESILAGISPDCLACARALPASPGGCDLPSVGCESFADAKARAQCLDTLRCVFPNTAHPSCIDNTNSNLTSCYCGSITVEDCLAAGHAKGRCKAEIEVGLGLASSDPGFVARNTTNVAHPSGRAMKLAKCVADVGRLMDARCLGCF